MRRILAADVGSTTTKVTLFVKDTGGWKLAGKMVAPTTVEAPDLDVMIGLRNALAKLERRTGIKLLDGARLLVPGSGEDGADIFVATSSAGGGLQMMVTGLVGTMTAESAHRAALGAGAVVSDVVSLDDNRTLIERLEAIKAMRPDMILLTGGTDGGNVSDVAAIAEYISMARPEPRFGKDFKIPVIYAGNVDARDMVDEVLREANDVTYTDNIRPELESERLGPAREAISRIFLEHVMMRAPGYGTLVNWTDGAVRPTPVAVGEALKYAAAYFGTNVLGVDIGGATTDVFSVIEGRLYRTVSANLGMSYSMANVLAEAKPDSILRWLPWEFDENIVRNWQFNKMVRPTTLPQTLEDLMLEQAVATEALRLSLEHHKSLVRGLKGVHQRRTVSDVFFQTGTGETLVKMMETGVIIGSGGALSHAPRWGQAALIMINAFRPEGVTELWVDNRFLLPHLGVLLETAREKADEAIREILTRETLVPVGTVIAPVGPAARDGSVIAEVRAGGESQSVTAGDMSALSVPAGGCDVEVIPKKEYDVGNGPGAAVRFAVKKGMPHLILDGRHRPLDLHSDSRRRIEKIKRWHRALSAYPDQDAAVETLAKEVS
ncbi:MAG TPA: methylaspartate mutase [Firmicutes bacterium]|nr:methylaspartate mutase [Candidatus Fermentithermobacillaceae bacterium]